MPLRDPRVFRVGTHRIATRRSAAIKFAGRLLALIALLVVVSALPVSADDSGEVPQEGSPHGLPTGQMLLIYSDVVEPSKVFAYETAVKELFALMAEQEVDSPLLHLTALADSEFRYHFVTPISDWGDIGRMQAEYGRLIEAIGMERWQQITEDGYDPVDRFSLAVAIHRPDLSYRPETPRTAPDEVRFIYHGHHYIFPDKIAEMEAITRDYVALAKEKGLPTAVDTYQAALGSDLPLYVVSLGAKSEADFATQLAAEQEMLGPEGQALQIRLLEVMRRYEAHHLRPRPDMSYPPPAAAGGEVEE